MKAPWISDLTWCSDWDGLDVGYDDVLVVGLYYSEHLGAHLYIDTETGELLEILMDEEETE